MRLAQVRGMLPWLERLFLVMGMMCLAWVFVTWKHAAFYQLAAKAEVERMRDAARPPRAPEAVAAAALPRGGSLIGVLEIPRLRVSVAVLEGDDDRALSVGAGHLPETPLPWDVGNVGVSGHRDTFFRPLRDMRVGDDIYFATDHGDFAYRVRTVMVVGPEDVWVLHRRDDVHLTLITCFPFDYVGPAPRRFVVQAERVSVRHTS